MNNPLLQKYDEIYGKKEEPKKVEYELPTEIKEQIKNPPLTDPTKKYLQSYDPHSINDSFLQVAELMKNGTAKVISMTMNTDAFGGFYTGKRTVTFEVDIWDSP
jgi:hypothetical protein